VTTAAAEAAVRPAVAADEPRERWTQLVVLTAGILLAEAPWFASGAVAPLLRVEWRATGLDLPLLTVAVQLGFAVGALGLAIVGAADVIPGIRLAGARKDMDLTAAITAAREAGRNYITVASEFLGQDA
jgi:hypothetical protein